LGDADIRRWRAFAREENAITQRRREGEHASPSVVPAPPRASALA
jgi:hypothetical protein